MFIIALLGILIIFTLLGILRMNNPGFRKCPNCSEKVENGVIVCRICGVNINSLQDLTQLTEKTVLRKIKDYLDDLSQKDARYLGFFMFLIFLVGFAIVAYFK